MSESIYKPKACAFHPKQYIFNFCKSPQCLLPLCPSCVKIHSDEHRTQQSYGHFENMNKVVNDVNHFFQQSLKQISNHNLDIKQHQQLKIRQQQELRKRITEAKSKMITLVQRYFSDFQKEVNKHIVCFNQSIRENYTKVGDHMADLKRQLEEKSNNLTSEKVLKTTIGFYAREQDGKYTDQLNCIKNRIQYLNTQKVEVVCNPNVTQGVIEELGNYIHLSFQNWQNQVKYVGQFVKSAFMSTGQSGFNKSVST